MEKSLRSEYFWREGHFGENPEDAYIRKETLQEMLDGMTDNQREVFVLYYKCGYTASSSRAKLSMCLTLWRPRCSTSVSAAETRELRPVSRHSHFRGKGGQGERKCTGAGTGNFWGREYLTVRV